MATAPKAAPKAGPKPVAAPEAAGEAAPKPSKKKLIILIAVAVIVIAGAGGGALFFMRGAAPSGAAPSKETKTEASKLPVFVTMEPFTVNLQSETGDQFLQVTLTLQVPDAAQEELLKSFMPQLRSRLLFLLSSKKASEISTVDGKKKLSEDIITTANQPFTAKGPPQTVSDVFFTSFVIQ
ncbi:MAG TPA: flagellar basal body-associated protein FliL [Burkholderiaceae bacterium]|jgi:flagellar FliL protein|nr:flagellar basal body-associated protein FliL [Burkholderiaceae bacterium]